MKIEVTTAIMKEWFINYNRDYYSWEGLETLLNYYNEIDEQMEFDPVAICCDCTEYGDGAACSLDDLINDYGFSLDRDEWEEENAERLEGIFDTTDDYITALIEVLEDKTTVLQPENGNIIVFAF